MNLRNILREEIINRDLRAGDGQFYLVSMPDADKLDVRCSSLRSVGQADRGISRPEIVVTDQGLRGFRKDSRTMDGSDDPEIVVNLWGRCLGLPMAQEYRVFDRNLQKDSLLSMDVAAPGWTFREMRRIREAVEEQVRTGWLAAADWMMRWRQVCLTRAFPEIEGNVENICGSEEDYRITIEVPLLMAACVFPDCADDLETFRRDYFRMIMFDLFIGQTDRTLHNYGVLIRGDKEAFRLAPLFDNATLTKPYLPENIYTLNGAAADRARLLKILIRDYGAYTIPAAEHIRKVWREKGSRMDEISELWIDNFNLPLLRRNTERFQNMLNEAGLPRT